MKHLLFVLLALPIRLLADGGLPTQPYIYVEGEAKIEKAADIVTLRFELSALQPEQAAANKLVQAQANKVFALLKSAEIADKDVIAGELQSAAEYEGNEDSSRRGKLLGYRVTRSFTVKVRDVAQFPKLVDDLLALKVHEFSSIDGGLSKEEELKDQVWDKAVANARERAEKTLKSTGMKVESIYAISPVAFPQIAPNIFGEGGSRSLEYRQAASAGKERIEPSQYRLAPVSVTQTIHLIYLISPAK